MKGDCLGTAADLAAQLSWHPAAVDRYHRRDTVTIAERCCLW
ncbi:hypothetical protein [Streptomyces violascens]|nr:hypothetical protein [Streptomyces violascens]